MKISIFINILNKFKEEHGDFEIYCWPYDGQGRHYPGVSLVIGGEGIVFLESMEESDD